MDPQVFNTLREGTVLYLILVSSIAIHEWAHAFMADRLDDPLPRAQGRVTLNPLAHIDMIGTVFLPLFMIFSPLFLGGAAPFALIGWGKPVMISLPNPKTRKRDDNLITAAGPLSNLIIAMLVAFAWVYFSSSESVFVELLPKVFTLNVVLFVFNLIPIPPLDGSHFLKNLINMSEETYYNFARWGFLILIILINLPPFRAIMFAAINTVANGLLAIAQMLIPA